MRTPQRVSRRGVLLAAAGAAAAGIEGCSTKPTPSNIALSSRTPGATVDIAFLRGLLDLERFAAAAYAAAIPLLSRPAARAGKQFLAHELAHASELEGLIEQAGGRLPLRPASYDLGHPRDEHELLELLHRAERAQVAGYLSAMRWVKPPRMRAAFAAIVANDAQHVAVLRRRLGLAPVPAALVGSQE